MIADAATWVAVGAAALGAGFALFLLHFHKIGQRFPELTPSDHPIARDDAPRVSVIIAMRNEARWVERCVRSILQQDHPQLEVVLVDDRSDDDTWDRMQRLAAEVGPQVRTLRVRAVPGGWGGQNHAFACAADVATGRYLLFTDADCRLLSSRTVAVAVAEAEAEGLGLLSLIPRMEGPTWFERMYLPACSFVYLHGLQIGHINEPTHDAGFAFGPFMMIRRDAYDAMGGHERVRWLINGDVAFGRIAKAEHIPSRVYGNQGLSSTRMYTTVRQAWAGWTRNFANSIQSPGRLFTGALLLGGFLVVPWLGLLTTAWLASGDARWWTPFAAFAAALVVVGIGMVRMVSAMQLHPLGAVLYLPGACFMTALSLRATAHALLLRPTVWHGVTYPAPVRVPPRSVGAPPSYELRSSSVAPGGGAA